MVDNVIIQLLVRNALAIHWFAQLVIESVVGDVTIHHTGKDVSTTG